VTIVSPSGAAGRSGPRGGTSALHHPKRQLGGHCRTADNQPLWWAGGVDDSRRTCLTPDSCIDRRLSAFNRERPQATAVRRRGALRDFAAAAGAGTKDPMARRGTTVSAPPRSTRTRRGALTSAITDAIDADLDDARKKDGDDDSSLSGALVPAANGTLMARQGGGGLGKGSQLSADRGPDLGFGLERAKGIEPS
jgi:hypothetical protein